ncbi:LLM class flavin-dependent oxidoreductase [Glutamicibacter sp. MNS18]|uniref:LLM class flavin-dependent oxidoreductase n=1 Tax=Glutamicibacter sp. MNS18 TaxID=2989817 RepID=UPI00223545C6|nr:LLM class flavin-dependent oxidoreductase [Glutamicibacter sp. MNS18]MCW4465964.1 LLM class flavin-dependent oxidoreductase [Glutamicibacter sp. MNS18]
MTRSLILNAFLMTTGHHESSWRLPESDTGAGTDIRHYQRLAQLAEQAKFDAVFFADSPVLQAPPAQRPAGALDPVTLLAALATATEKIGLIATASTSYNEPYNLARKFASLDAISNGRSGWNVVTTAGDAAARNFSRNAQPDSSQRYARAEEFLKVTERLWDSWEDDARVGDKDSGVWAAPTRIHRIDHQGEHFQVAGPLNVPRSPQGRPVIIQAGASEAGKGFAARWAEAIFTAHQSLASAQDFYRELKARAAEVGRNSQEVKILPGIVPILGSTQTEAQRLADELDALILPQYALQNLAQVLHVDPAELDLDRVLPQGLGQLVPAEKSTSRRDLVLGLGYERNLTVRQIIRELGPGRGHQTLVGTPEQAADHIEQWFTQGAADGFNIMAPVLPSGLEYFVEHVVPILRQRGLFREDYEDSTLRGHYGLPVPRNHFARERAHQEQVA